MVGGGWLLFDVDVVVVCMLLIGDYWCCFVVGWCLFGCDLVFDVSLFDVECSLLFVVGCWLLLVF